MAEPPIGHVQDTAFWVAVYRAQESERADALFKDPYARLLTGERGFKISQKMRYGAATAWSVVIRTCIIDEYIRVAVASGVDTVLNLGAGLDARPYRMELPASLRWIEIDYPEMLERKAERLRSAKPCCHLERIKLDLADRTARRQILAEIGAASGGNVLVMTEGVVPYLSVDDTATLADDLHGHPQFRGWIVDYLSPELMRYLTGSKNRRQMQNAPFVFRPDDWSGFFSSHGWTVKEMRYLGEESERLRRSMPMPLWTRPMTVFMSEERRRAMQRLAGYAILQPV